MKSPRIPLSNEKRDIKNEVRCNVCTFIIPWDVTNVTIDYLYDYEDFITAWINELNQIELCIIQFYFIELSQHCLICHVNYYCYLLQKGKQRRAAKKAQTGLIDILNINDNAENDNGEELQNNSILMSMAMSPTNLNNLNNENYGHGHGNILDKNQRNVLSPLVSDNDIELNKLEFITGLNSNNENYEDNNSNVADRGNNNVDSDSEGEGGGDEDNGERERGIERERGM